MLNPKVDVVIPVYNAATTLEEAIRSIQTQTLCEIRIILIDDGSTDGTPAILARIAERDSRVLIIRQRNSGIVDALNAGLQACRAKYIARHDADDLARPDRLEKQVRFLDNNPAVDAVSGAFRHIDLDGKWTGETITFPPPSEVDPTWVPAKEPYLSHPFLVVRRSAFEAVGGYRYVFHAEDADLYWRLQERGVLHNLPDVLGDYRLNPLSISSRSILNGRIQSLGLQLAAISALRRRSGLEDIIFRKRSLTEYESACTLESIVSIGSSQLTESEAKHLRISVAERLRGLAAYRPYELEFSDCTFIAGSYRLISVVASARNRSGITARLSGAAAQLILSGKVRKGLALCPPALYAQTLSRVLIQSVLPRSLWRRLRRPSRATSSAEHR